MDNIGPDCVTLEDGTLLCSGRVKMIVPLGGKHVRQAEVRLPRMSEPTVVVVASVVAKETAGTIFALYGANAKDLGDQLQVAFSATNVIPGEKSDNDFYCSYLVRGEPIIGK